ncbi:unnamed protein product [Durusdinium trenchii]|uniref:Uncharacterized protein n=1 Tax=Durusdinium trenchii TaxID=1381693 RepID=A0ABP0PIQ1_9DINO
MSVPLKRVREKSTGATSSHKVAVSTKETKSQKEKAKPTEKKEVKEKEVKQKEVKKQSLDEKLRLDVERRMQAAKERKKREAEKEAQKKEARKEKKQAGLEEKKQKAMKLKERENRKKELKVEEEKLKRKAEREEEFAKQKKRQAEKLAHLADEKKEKKKQKSEEKNKKEMVEDGNVGSKKRKSDKVPWCPSKKGMIEGIFTPKTKRPRSSSVSALGSETEVKEMTKLLRESDDEQSESEAEELSLAEEDGDASSDEVEEQALQESDEEGSEEKIEARLKDFLKVSGQVRTGAISIKELDFAQDLAKKMLGHASSMEAVYHEVAKLAKVKSPERALKEGEPRMEELEKKSAKLQATSDRQSIQCPVPSLDVHAVMS